MEIYECNRKGGTLHGSVCIKKVGTLNPFWNSKIRELALDYKYPFGDIDEIRINTDGEVTVVFNEEQIKTMTKEHAYDRGFVIWEGNEKGIFYARSQNRNDSDYGKVYQIIT